MQRHYVVEQFFLFSFAVFFCIVMALGDREGGRKRYILYNCLVRYCVAIRHRVLCRHKASVSRWKILDQ